MPRNKGERMTQPISSTSYQGNKVKECPLCDRLKDADQWSGRLVYEDDFVLVTHEIDTDEPTYLGVVLMQTKRHTEHGLTDLTDSEGQRIGLLVAQISRALRDLVSAAWTYTYCFTEAYQHVHQFVCARYPNMPPEYVRLRFDEWKEAPRGTPVQVAELSKKLGARLRISSSS
jgi:diadenosine tetraphosphate (Ap4A) HIT family hydrolase